ncbi:MAG: hypothetical protein ABR958_08800 [Dehalococcoidales bacterium]
MKKAIKRFWGVGLIILLLSTMFVSAAPASAGIYSWSQDTTQPTATNLLFAPTQAATFGYTDIAATSDGANIYMVADNTAGGTLPNYLYKSTNGGVSWSKPSGGTAASPFTAALPNATTDNWTFIAVAPDDPNIVVVVDGTVAPAVYLSTNGGASFSNLTGLSTYITTVNDIAISAPSGPYRYIAVAGNNGSGLGKLCSWTYGSAAPLWSDKSSTVSGMNVGALAFSPSFPSDNTVLFVSNNTTTNVTTLHAYSYNVLGYDSAVDATFPRVLRSDAILNRASIALDPTFYMGDAASQIGFIGASLTSATGEVGGVFRIGTYTVSSGVVTMTQIMTATAIGYVAWDGTNLAAAPLITAQLTPTAAITIYRSADSLSSSIPTFAPGSGAKTPGTGFEPKLLWNAGNLLCISRGTNAAVARSADLGKSFNGIALANTSWTTVNDFWVSPDGTVIYVLADDGIDLNIWRYKASAWQRVFVSANASTQIWELRAAASDPTAVFLGKKGATNMFISTDSGETKWTARSCSQAIQDFAVESASIVYGGTGNNVVKSTNGAFTWGAGVNTNIGLYGGGSIYSLTLVAAGKLVVGGSSGGVAYSSDSGATWSQLVNLSTSTCGSVVAAASGLGTGDTFYATDNLTNAIYKWIIGTNTPISGWTAGKALAAAGTGIQLTNGVLYVQEASATTSNITTRDLTPAVGISAPFCDNVTTGVALLNSSAGGYPINALQASTTALSTTLWGVTATKLYSWTEYLAVAANAPATTFPANGYMVPVNSINGYTNNFVFQWTQPSNQNGAVSSAQTYAYTLNVYLDSAGKILYSTGSVAATTSGTLSLSAASLSVSNFTPGATYYWKVKTTSPVTSQYTPMLSLTIQSIAAPVPVVNSPANGSTITNQNPAFSWAPVTGTTLYDFQLSTTPSFGTLLLTDQPATAGTLVPITIKLDQGKQYFWRVRANQPVTGDWSSVANFFVALPTTAAPPPVTVTNVPAPTITIPAPAPAPTYTLAPQPVEKIAPTYIWAIIIIGAILVIAVIVLIVRTRRSV